VLSAVDEVRVQANDGHGAWSESFNELFAQVAGEFGNAARRTPGVRREKSRPVIAGSDTRQPSLAR
jgi:hypothetical protein